MAGYSGTPLPKKLGIKEGARVVLQGAPPGFRAALGDVPPGVEFASGGKADVMVCFATDVAELGRRFPDWKEQLEWAGGLWVAWPKRKPGAPSPSLSENAVREIGLAAGLVDNKVCAIDDDWSGLRFVWRVADRPAKSGRTKA